MTTAQQAYGLDQNRIAHAASKARQAFFDEYKPYMACHQALSLQSIEHVTDSNSPRWVGQVNPFDAMDKIIPITLWQDDIDFINGIRGLNIGTEPIIFDEPFDIITTHANIKYGLNQAEACWSNHTNTYLHKSRVNTECKALALVVSEPLATPIAQAVPKKPQRGYLHLRDLLKHSAVYLPLGDPLSAKMERLVQLGYAQREKHNIWSATNKQASVQEAVTLVEKPLVIGTKVYLYNPSRKAFMQNPHTITAIDNDWYGVQHPHLEGLNYYKRDMLLVIETKSAELVEAA